MVKCFTILVCSDDDGTAWWPGRDSNGRDCDGIGVVGMQGKQCKVSAQGDVTVHIPSVCLDDVDHVVLDHPVPFGEKWWGPGQGNAV